LSLIQELKKRSVKVAHLLRVQVDDPIAAKVVDLHQQIFLRDVKRLAPRFLAHSAGRWVQELEEAGLRPVKGPQPGSACSS
jgi:hypothetical protein